MAIKRAQTNPKLKWAASIESYVHLHINPLNDGVKEDQIVIIWYDEVDGHELQVGFWDSSILWDDNDH